MKLRRAFADANKIVRRSMDFRYIGELTDKVGRFEPILSRFRSLKERLDTAKDILTMLYRNDFTRYFFFF